MKSYLLTSLILVIFYNYLISQPNIPRYENPQIEFKYTVVIGSMLKLENAERLHRLAIEKGYECFIAPVNIRNKQHYRVCVGLYQEFSKSKEQLKIIKNDFKIRNAWIWQAPQITEMKKQEPKKVEQQQNFTKVEPQKVADRKPESEMKKIVPPTQSSSEVTKPQAQTNLPDKEKDIPLTVPTPPTKPQTPKVAEQPKTEPKPETPKVAEQPKTEPKPETSKVSQKPDKSATQVKTTQKNKPTDSKIAKSEKETTAPKPETITPKELTPPILITDSLLQELSKAFTKFVTSVRNYEYAEANKFIHPELHFYVIYNEESKPSVREFNSLEKFFAVFSAFTGKGTTLDFSNDINQILNKKPIIMPYPTYDCSTHKYNQKGLIVSTAKASDINLLNAVRTYYRSFNQDLLPEIAEKVSRVESRIQASVIDTDGSFIEGMYFGYINEKWYLLVLDIKFRCR